ncbi:MAG: hypothetical protein VCE12_06395, partial [Candidatus Latescibacterota bacterium]
VRWKEGVVSVFQGTQWGRGEVGTDGFDFGQGNVSTDFVGSIAVDGDGFICGADEGNGRIQKFAP